MNYKYYKDFDEHIYTKTLDNGLKIVLIPKTNFQQTVAFFTTNFGGNDISFYPNGKKRKVNQPAGIAHFLEHKLFKNPDETDVFELANKLGIDFNAFTDYDFTNYLFSGTNNINDALKLLLDFVQTPYFTKRNIEKEQGIIEEEINMYADSPAFKMSLKLFEQTYKNHPIKNDILGDVNSIYKIKANDLYKAYDKFYHPTNMFLTIVGNFNVEEILKIITDNQNNKKFDIRQPIERPYLFEPHKVSKKFGFEEFNISMPYVGVSVKFKPENEPKKSIKNWFVIQMLFEYYFSNSGIIYNSLLKNNLINNSFDYYVINNKNISNCQLISYSNFPEEFINVIEKALINLKRRKIEENRFKMIKRSFYGTFIKSLNNITGYSYNLLNVVPYNLELFEILEIINEIKINDLKELAQQIKQEYITSYYLTPFKKV